MQIDRPIFRRALFSLPIKIIELILHDLQEIARRSSTAIGGVIIAAGNVIGDHDHFAAACLDTIGDVAVKGIGPPDEAILFGDEIERVRRRRMSGRKVSGGLFA